jgi:diaminohydroxyphosphoribosylaminopyrimidine deaminase / 5-amino-6-(5-phosphoribosylamino)uracil reductase
MPFTPTDLSLMSRAIALGASGLATATPNPSVGCVIARDDAVLGEGFHSKAGTPHAEVMALRDAQTKGKDVKGATAYVTLEPCNHYGRTPPCSKALIEAGVARVVVAVPDPNPQAAGGAQTLQAVGIAVEFGCMQTQAEELHKGFLSRMRRGRPWLTLKLAASVDGRTALANGQSQWITSEASRIDVHQLRSIACGMLTGAGTVDADDPSLTVRHVSCERQPTRIVIDNRMELSLRRKIFNTNEAPTVLITTEQALLSHKAKEKRDAFENAGVRVVAVEGALKTDLTALLRTLGQLQMNHVVAEVGHKLAGSLITAEVVDEIVLYQAPLLLGDTALGLASFGTLEKLSDAPPFAFHAVERIGTDLKLTLRPVNRKR